MLFRVIPLFLFLFKIWRRLPARQKQKMLVAVGRHGPRLARVAVKQARARRRRF
jgi:hypothetical protein